MDAAIQGAMIGFAVAAGLLAVEYLMVRKAVDERGKRLNRKLEMEPTERGRIATMARFCVLVPPAFALFFWVIWG